METRKKPILFTVFGEPRPQGSKIAQVIYGRDGKPVTKNNRVVCVARDDNRETKHWRHQVAAAARAVYRGPLLTGPIHLSLTFRRPRPKSHFGSGRNAGLVKTGAPPYPTTKPDTVKLTRAVEDALTGVIWRDDSQVVWHSLWKIWGECFALNVEISEIPS